MKKALSWQTKRRGATYCAPACGFGCTHAAYEQAKADAAALVKRLRGTGWTAHVWENLGWHYAARRGTLAVYVSGVSTHTYWCLLSDDPDRHDGGSGLWSQREHFRDPNKAVQAQLALAETVMARLRAAIEAGWP